MRKARYLIPFLILALQACSYTDIASLLPAAPTSPPPVTSFTATAYRTPTRTSTITPTQPTPTFTGTPTLTYSGPTPTPSITPVATGIVLFLTPPTDTPVLISPEQNSLFTTILVSGNQLYWGSCEPHQVKVTAHVTDVAKVRTVLLELSLKDVKTGDTTAWGGGAIMDDDGTGTFTYNLTAQNFEHYRDYMRAWGRFQAVAFDSKMNRLGGSALYLTSITIAPCS